MRRLTAGFCLCAVVFPSGDGKIVCEGEDSEGMKFGGGEFVVDVEVGF